MDNLQATSSRQLQELQEKARGAQAKAKEAAIIYLLEELGRQAEEHKKQPEVQASK